MIDSILNEYQELPDENDLPNEFSSEFQIWSQKLIRKTHNPYWYYVNTTVKKVILIAIILSMMTMTALAVPSIREAIIRRFHHTIDDGNRNDPLQFFVKIVGCDTGNGNAGYFLPNQCVCNTFQSRQRAF